MNTHALKLSLDLHTKNIKRKKNQEPKIWSLQKNVCSVKNEKTNSYIVLPICLNQGKKDGSALMFRMNP